jgi:hypothetical protein
MDDLNNIYTEETINKYFYEKLLNNDPWLILVYNLYYGIKKSEDYNFFNKSFKARISGKEESDIIHYARNTYNLLRQQNVINVPPEYFHLNDDEEFRRYTKQFDIFPIWNNKSLYKSNYIEKNGSWVSFTSLRQLMETLHTYANIRQDTNSYNYIVNNQVFFKEEEIKQIQSDLIKRNFTMNEKKENPWFDKQYILKKNTVLYHGSKFLLQNNNSIPSKPYAWFTSDENQAKMHIVNELYTSKSRNCYAFVYEYIVTDTVRDIAKIEDEDDWVQLNEMYGMYNKLYTRDDYNLANAMAYCLLTPDEECKYVNKSFNGWKIKFDLDQTMLINPARFLTCVKIHVYKYKNYELYNEHKINYEEYFDSYSPFPELHTTTIYHQFRNLLANYNYVNDTKKCILQNKTIQEISLERENNRYTLALSIITNVFRPLIYECIDLANSILKKHGYTPRLIITGGESVNHYLTKDKRFYTPDIDTKFIFKKGDFYESFSLLYHVICSAIIEFGTSNYAELYTYVLQNFMKTNFMCQILGISFYNMSEFINLDRLSTIVNKQLKGKSFPFFKKFVLMPKISKQCTENLDEKEYKSDRMIDVNLVRIGIKLSEINEYSKTKINILDIEKLRNEPNGIDKIKEELETLGLYFSDDDPRFLYTHIINEDEKKIILQNSRSLNLPNTLKNLYSNIESKQISKFYYSYGINEATYDVEIDGLIDIVLVEHKKFGGEVFDDYKKIGTGFLLNNKKYFCLTNIASRDYILHDIELMTALKLRENKREKDVIRKRLLTLEGSVVERQKIHASILFPNTYDIHVNRFYQQIRMDYINIKEFIQEEILKTRGMGPGKSLYLVFPANINNEFKTEISDVKIATTAGIFNVVEKKWDCVDDIYQNNIRQRLIIKKLDKRQKKEYKNKLKYIISKYLKQSFTPEVLNILSYVSKKSVDSLYKIFNDAEYKTIVFYIFAQIFGFIKKPLKSSILENLLKFYVILQIFNPVINIPVLQKYKAIALQIINSNDISTARIKLSEYFNTINFDELRIIPRFFFYKISS